MTTLQADWPRWTHPDQPGVDGAKEAALTLHCTLDLGHIAQQPQDLGRTEIGRDRQATALSEEVSVTATDSFDQILTDRRRPHIGPH